MGPPDPGDALFKNPIIHPTRTQQSLRARPESRFSNLAQDLMRVSTYQIRWANAEETKEELDAILGTGSYVVNADGSVELLEPID